LGGHLSPVAAPQVAPMYFSTRTVFSQGLGVQFYKLLA